MKDRISGKTLRWTFEDGPMAGKTFEHTFGSDGTVRFRAVTHEVRSEQAESSTAKKYESARLRDDIYVVSYLGTSGYTLTAVLDFEKGTVVAVASNEKQLVLQHGSFERVKRAA